MISEYRVCAKRKKEIKEHKKTRQGLSVISVAFFEHVHYQSKHSMHNDQAVTETVQH